MFSESCLQDQVRIRKEGREACQMDKVLCLVNYKSGDMLQKGLLQLTFC